MSIAIPRAYVHHRRTLPQATCHSWLTRAAWLRPQIREEKIRQIRGDFGYELFAQGEFHGALSQLWWAAEPVKRVLGLFPQLLPEGLTLQYVYALEVYGCTMCSSRLTWCCHVSSVWSQDELPREHAAPCWRRSPSLSMSRLAVWRS